MDYNSAFPHAFTPCQISRIHADLRGEGHAYIYKESAYAPAMPILLSNSKTNCQTKNYSVVLDASNSTNVSRYRWIIAQDRRVTFTSDWHSGSPSFSRLEDMVTLSPGSNYIATLEVTNNYATEVNQASTSFRIDSCPDTTNTLMFQMDNPVHDHVRLIVTSEREESMTAFITSVNGRSKHSLFKEISISPGQSEFTENISWLAPGTYCITLIGNSTTVSKLFFKL
jgi:hypothetical protein